MTQRELEREIARTTGETLTTIRRHGFSLVEPAEAVPHTVDWDRLDAQRMAILPANRRQPAAV
jgi:hypothetical protein